ncbi:MAG: IS66 family insertion sequence element accessory protein TnpA [Pseudomonadota bacterium]
MSSSVKPSRQVFWQNHLQRAVAERLSIRAYARREGLSEQSLYAAKRKLSAIVPVASAFAKVCVSGQPDCELSLPGGVTLRLPEVPSTGWLAALRRELAP